MNKIEINPEFKKALELMEKSTMNVFITGKAGTGKSTLLTYFRENTKKKIVVLAPTGVAAVNIGGQTVHSFFKFKPDITPGKVRKLSGEKSAAIFKKLEAVIIDEISMVRADLLDCIDKSLRLNGPNFKKPFGGVQMIFIGDLYQLPPVVTYRERQLFRDHYQSPYFFSSKVFEKINLEFVELEKIYRQKDQNFINLLNTIRNNSAGETELAMINKRLQPDFEPKIDDFYIYLTPMNQAADLINQKRLQSLSGKNYCYKGSVNGDFKPSDLPTSVELDLKIGAQVMLLNNDLAGRWINGSIGQITKIKKDTPDDEILVQLTSGKMVKVKPYLWELFHFYFDRKNQRIESEIVGSFYQFPLKLAWALTIHKSQGKTFEKIIFDIDRGTFAAGQVYVALSRATSLEGVILKKPIAKKHLFIDWQVVKFLTRFQYAISEKNLSLENKVEIIKEAINNNQTIEIIYLKANDTKSRRQIIPKSIGHMEYLDKEYLGIEAFCLSRQEDRNFRVDRILEIKIVE